MRKREGERKNERENGDADDDGGGNASGGGGGRRRTGKLREQVTFDLKSGGRLAGG